MIFWMWPAAFVLGIALIGAGLSPLIVERAQWAARQKGRHRAGGSR